MKSPFGSSPLQQQIQQTQARMRMQQQRNLQGGWWMEQQRLKMKHLRKKHLYTGRWPIANQRPLPKSRLGTGSGRFSRVMPSRFQNLHTRKPLLKLKASATIRNVRSEFNVMQGNQKGMRIHIEFSTSKFWGRTGLVAAYFCFDDGTPLKDMNQKYRTTTGDVSAVQTFVPLYLNSQYDDFVLFIPYDELHMSPGKHNLKFIVRIWDDNTRELACSNWVFFNYSCT